MVDRITLEVPHFLSKEVTVRLIRPRFSMGTKFQLPNRFKDYKLEIVTHRKGFTLTGNLRKWYYSEESLEDLTQATLIDCLKMLAHTLVVPYDIILDGRLRTLEFGKNFKMSASPRELLPRLRYPCRERGQYYAGIKFDCVSYWLSAYDKVTEINQKRRKKDQAPIVAEHNWLRLEIKAFTYSSMSRMLRGTECLRDIIDNYKMVVSDFMREIHRINIKPILLGWENINLAELEPSDYKSYLLAKGIDARGGFVQVYLDVKLMKKLNAKQRYALKQWLKPHETCFNDTSQYSRFNFIREIQAQLKPEVNNARSRCLDE